MHMIKNPGKMMGCSQFSLSEGVGESSQVTLGLFLELSRERERREQRPGRGPAPALLAGTANSSCWELVVLVCTGLEEDKGR